MAGVPAGMLPVTVPLTLKLYSGVSGSFVRKLTRPNLLPTTAVSNFTTNVAFAPDAIDAGNAPESEKPGGSCRPERVNVAPPWLLIVNVFVGAAPPLAILP